MTAMISAMMAMVRVFISRPPSDVGGPGGPPVSPGYFPDPWKQSHFMPMG